MSRRVGCPPQRIHCAVSRFPIPANLRAKDLRSEIDKALRTVMLPLGHRGTCAMVEVGNALMGKVELVENITKACQVSCRGKL